MEAIFKGMSDLRATEVKPVLLQTGPFLAGIAQGIEGTSSRKLLESTAAFLLPLLENFSSLLPLKDIYHLFECVLSLVMQRVFSTDSHLNSNLLHLALYLSWCLSLGFHLLLASLSLGVSFFPSISLSLSVPLSLSLSVCLSLSLRHFLLLPHSSMCCYWVSLFSKRTSLLFLFKPGLLLVAWLTWVVR